MNRAACAVVLALSIALALAGCSPGSAADDAGRDDSATVDAGRQDAGTVDATLDDAARPDASTGDAGTSDAATVDAPALDAGGLDAASVDAGAPDASFEAIAETASCSAPMPAAGTYAEETFTYAMPGGVTLAFDVAYPTDGLRHPLVVLVHGGGWNSGTRTDMNVHTALRPLVAAGYTAASIDYRLYCAGMHDAGALCGAPARFPTQVSDTRCAIRSLLADSAHYAIADSPTRIGLVGTSAGGQIALMIAAASDDTSLDLGDCGAATPFHVDAVVGFYPVSDLAGPFPPDSGLAAGIPGYLGVHAGVDGGLYAEGSPVGHISAGDPPTLIVHGTADPTVPYAQSAAYVPALHAGGVHATLVTVPGAVHSFYIVGGSAPIQATCTTLAFLRHYLAP